MDRTTLIAGILGAGLVTGGAATMATNVKPGLQYADVLGYQEVKEVERTPRQECHDVVVTEQAPTSDPQRIAGTAIGAVLGGVIGSQIGGGNGKKLATVAGAAAGGYAGRQVQGTMQANNTVESVEQRCTTVYDETESVVGYDVHYTLDGEPGTVRMDNMPGDRIPFREGELVLIETTAPDTAT